MLPSVPLPPRSWSSLISFVVTPSPPSPIPRGSNITIEWQLPHYPTHDVLEWQQLVRYSSHTIDAIDTIINFLYEPALL
jgi:hypothetical protein